MKYKIYNQDVIEWAREYNKGKFHALISDTPYHLQSIVKRFGKKGSAPAKHGTDGVFSRSSKGFMGQTWDGGDIAFQPDTWSALGEHLYPGAFGMCFSASRNWHRLAVAIEDAGFIIHPTIFGWLNGQGFPKATSIHKQLNKKESEDAEMWEGHRYGLQALKPAMEPIIVFQKPYEGKPLDNIVETGAGAINIEGGRIPTQDEYQINRFDDGMKPFGNGAGHKFTSEKVGRPLGIPHNNSSNGIYSNGLNGSEAAGTTQQGRWPANFILDQSSAESLDRQTGILTSGIPSGKKSADNNIYGKYKNEDIPVTDIGDSGGASRFFYNVQEQIDEADPIYYCGKVSPKERNAGIDDERCNHPTMKPIALAKYLATLLLPPDAYAPRRILVPFSGVGSEMIGAALAGWEQICGIEFDTENGYVDIAHKRMEYWSNK